MQRMRFAILVACFTAAMAMTGKTAFSQDLGAVIRMTYQQQFDAADSAFSKLISAQPANGKYYYYSGENQLASYFIDTANIPFQVIGEKAADRFRKGIEADPNEALNYVGTGKVALIENDATTAKTNFDKAISFLPVKKSKTALSKPDQATILIRIAEAYVQVGSRDTANVFGLLRRAEALDSQNPELFLVRGDYWFNTLNNGNRAVENYRRAKDYSPNSTRAMVRLGQLYTKNRNYSDALEYYQQAIAVDPSFAPAYLEMGFLFNRTNDQEQSRSNFRKYLEMSTGNIAAKRKYANMLFKAEDFKGTIEQISQIMARDSTSFNDLNRALAYSYFEEKEYPEADYYIKKFFANAPAEKVTAKDFLYCGRILSKMGQDSLAVASLVESSNRDTTNTDLLNEIAASYLKTRKPENAAKIYQLKIRRTGGNTNDYYKMARAWFDARIWNEADSALAMVNRLSPDFEPAYLFRARVYANLDPDTKEGLAKPHYDKVVEKASADPAKYSKDLLEAYNYLGYYFLVNKQYCESLSYWDKILGLDPANENAASALRDLKSHCPDFKPVNQSKTE